MTSTKSIQDMAKVIFDTMKTGKLDSSIYVTIAVNGIKFDMAMVQKGSKVICRAEIVGQEAPLEFTFDV